MEFETAQMIEEVKDDHKTSKSLDRLGHHENINESTSPERRKRTMS